MSTWNRYFEASFAASILILFWPDFCIRFVFVIVLPPTVYSKNIIWEHLFFGEDFLCIDIYGVIACNDGVFQPEKLQKQSLTNCCDLISCRYF